MLRVLFPYHRTNLKVYFVLYAQQLCINYANEKLQQKFTHDVFKTVQTEYEEVNRE